MLCSRPFVKELDGGVVKVPFPCGQCFHCRVNQGRVWQTRLILESMTSYDSTFLTLTYDDDHVPADFNLDKSHLTKFLKRYRKRLMPGKIRYYAVGEYGDETWRPHFHLAIFSDIQIERCYKSCEDMRKSGHCTQDCIARLSWKMGNVSVTPTLGQENAAYITGYIKKKATKERLINRVPEYATMSRKGGIGIEGIKRIAEKYKRVLGDRSPSIIRQLNFGNSSRPIGGYLEAILSDKLGIDQLTRQAEFVTYSNETFLKYRDEDGEILKNILETFEGKREAREKRSKIFTKKRSL